MPRIEEIPWHTLHHAYGTCDQFPDVMRWLASADPKDRFQARNWLEELLFHQGTHYPANEFAVPFLLQAAADAALPERERYFAFLNRFLVNGKPPLSPGQRVRRNQKLQKQLQYGFGDGAEHWRDYRRRSIAAAWGCRVLLARVLQNDPVPAARCWAAFVLADLAKTGRRDGGGWTEERPTSWYTAAAAAEILKLLRERALTDSSPAVRVSAAFGIGFLRDEAGAAEALVELFSQADGALRLAAAAARHVAEPSVPAHVTACVVNGVVQNLLQGQRSGCVASYDPDSPLAAAYANLGLPLCEVDPGASPLPPAEPFAFVPFPRVPAWLNASLDERLPLAGLVLQSLQAATPGQRVRAVRLLGSVRLPQPDIAVTLKRLMSHADPSVRMAAAVALRRRNRKSPAAPFVEVFRVPLGASRATLRRRAVQGLLSLWSPGADGPIPTAMPFVVEAAERETNREVQRLMCKLFARAAIEDRAEATLSKRSSRILARWLADPEICREAVAALAGMCWPPGQRGGRSMPTEAFEPLLALLNSDAPERRSVPRILRRVRSPRVLPALLDALRRETDPDTRQSLCWALQSLPRSAGAVDAVLAAHRDSGLLIDGPVSQFLSLAMPKSEEVALVLVQVLQAPTTDALARQKVAEALGCLKVAPENVADALLRAALADPADEVRAEAAQALVCAKIPIPIMLPRAKQIAESGEDAALSGLLELLDCGNTPKMPGLARSLLPFLDHPHYWRRQKTVSALARIAAQDVEVERAVLRKLDDEHTSVRFEATKYSFRCLPPEEVIPRLLKALREASPSIYAWWNLKGLGPHSEYEARASTEVLLPIAEQLLGSQTGLFVSDICDWLKEQGPAAAAIVPRLLTLLEDPSPKSRFAKIEALLAVDPSQASAALRALEPMLTHELDAVRAHAAKVRDKILD